MSAVRIAVVSAGLRVPSSTRLLADQLGGAVAASVRGRGGEVAVDVVELRELAHEIADALLTGFPGGQLRDAVERVVGADALVLVTPTFGASYSGLFKSFLDVLEPEALAGMPVLLAATGGTERHSLMLEFALRPLVVYLGAAPVHTAVFAAASDFGATAGAPSAERLHDRVARAAEELAEALARVGSGRAAARRAADPFEDVTPFAELLAGREPPPWRPS